MREIKFRQYVWDNDSKTKGRMSSWEELLTEWGESLVSTFTRQFSNASPLMQYTGLKDKNGKDIYEGDGLRLSAHQDLFVEYYKEARFVARSTNKVQRVNWYPFHLHEVVDMGYSVIGNVYENPTLLEGDPNV